MSYTSDTATIDKVVDLISNAKLSLGIANGQGLGALLLTIIAVLIIVWKRSRVFGKLLEAATKKR